MMNLYNQCSWVDFYKYYNDCCAKHNNRSKLLNFEFQTHSTAGLPLDLGEVLRARWIIILTVADRKLRETKIIDTVELDMTSLL